MNRAGTEVPVLVIAFNRPDHLRVLLDRLREVRPQHVFVAIDGARDGRPDEAERVQACRDLVAAIDWTSDVRTLFQDSNLGCGMGVSTAISWFFSQVDAGIILEDDIIPHPTFFPFCAELLDRYAADERVFAVSGCNFVPPAFQSRPQDAYRFSQIPHIWGWATWRRSWHKHRLDIAGWQRELPPTKLWARAGHSLPATIYWASTFELLARKQVDTWDGQFVLASMIDGQLTATSNVNLIENIGFDALATHTVGNDDRNQLQLITPMRLPTTPVPVELDAKADAWTRKHHFRASWGGMVQQLQTYLAQRRS